jgi:hypothetical protein
VSKPDLSHVRRALMVYVARAHEFGDQQPGRARGDWLERRTRDALRNHLRAVVGHVMEELDALELGGAAARDRESGVLHLAHAAARINMAIAVGVLGGILPDDPDRVKT